MLQTSIVFLFVWAAQAHKNSCTTGVEEIFWSNSSHSLLSKWLQHNWENITSNDLQDVFRGCILKQTDSIFGGTILNQIARSYDLFPIPLIKKILHYLKDEGHDGYLIVTDDDGDVPLHSTIKGMANKEYVSVFASTFLKYTEHCLKATNNKGYVPLELAFELGNFQAVEVLLELSIEHDVIPHLTGTTFLHEAFKSGNLEYLEILIRVYAKLDVPLLPVLLKPDKRGNTAWYYLINRNKHHEIEQVMHVCNIYKINVNQLYVDPKRKTTMLHEAVRRNDRQAEKILRQSGSKDQPDSKGVWPSQRNHRFDSNSAMGNKTYHPVTSVKELNLMLEDVGNWEALCVNLGIRTGIIEELKYSRLEVSVIKLRCVQAYVNNGDATWEEVKLAVTLYPIQNSNIANKIKQKYKL